MHRTLLILAFSVLVAAPASAQALKLSFSDGRVSIEATSVPIRAILNEWAKLGGTKVVGAERIAGAPLTLTLVDVPEAQALDIVLRSVAGYLAAPRGTVAGASIYDRILVMAASATPSPATARPTAPSRPGSTAGTQRFIPSNRRPTPQTEQPEPDEEQDEEEEEDPNPPNPPVFTFPQPGQPGFGQPGLFNGPQGAGAPIVTVNPVTGAPESITINPAPLPSAPSDGPTTPFGTTGSTMPGMIQQPPPQPGRTTQPGPMVRPPG